jgi:5-methylcytosine-specific restriction endonuclease McrA
MTSHDRRLATRQWRALRLWVLDRDGHRCQMRLAGCLGVATTVDHIMARADGGNCWDPANLRAACHRCNSRAGGDVGNARRWQYHTGVADYVTRF